MSKIIRQPKTLTGLTYRLHYDFLDEPGSGFSFLCDASGIVDETHLQAQGRANLLACRIGKFNNGEEVRCMGVQEYPWKQVIPALLHCDCGFNVLLDHSINTCRCDADYNPFGQRLAPREQWGEETGETYADILTGGYDVL